MGTLIIKKGYDEKLNVHYDAIIEYPDGRKSYVVAPIGLTKEVLDRNWERINEEWSTILSS